MIPRSRTDVVRGEDTVDDVLAKMATGHTRYPVVGEDSDDVIGIVDLHDLLVLCDDDQNSALTPVSGVMRAPIVVPTSLPLPEVASRLSAEKAEMAVVVDEYGGFAGVVTMEDMAEEIVVRSPTNTTPRPSRPRRSARAWAGSSPATPTSTRSSVCSTSPFPRSTRRPSAVWSSRRSGTCRRSAPASTSPCPTPTSSRRSPPTGC